MDQKRRLFIGHDLGTGGDKAVLIDAAGEVLATALASYEPTRAREGWVEQDPEVFWDAVCETTRALASDAARRGEGVRAMAFAGQMLSLVPMRDARTSTRKAIIWMDSRAEHEARALIRRCGGRRVLRFLAGALPTGKDLIPKLHWIRDNEPEVFRETRAFVDATGYLAARATGTLAIDRTGASGTGVLVPGSGEWSRLLAALASFPTEKMPPVVLSTHSSSMNEEGANACGLPVGTRVMAGLSDIPAAAVGSGAVLDGDVHIYLGTSAWVCLTSKLRLEDAKHGIASIASADPMLSLSIGESETAGACVDWWTARFCSALSARDARTAFDAYVEASPAGADGLLFAPWMHGERAPVSDSLLRGAFLNLSLSHEPRHFARAILEGIALNLRWTLTAFEKMGVPARTLRALGGGAQSDAWLQVIADVTGRSVERVSEPRFAGAKGAALLAAVGAGAFSSLAATKLAVRVDQTFSPRKEHAQLYAKLFAALQAAYPGLSAVGRAMSG